MKPVVHMGILVLMAAGLCAAELPDGFVEEKSWMASTQRQPSP